MIYLFFLLGLILGSFLNVVAHRTQANEDWVNGRSSCDSCDHVLRWYELIPVVSWLLQRGRCRSCGVRLSIEYPLVELTSGLLFAGSYAFWSRELGSSMENVLFGLWLFMVALLLILIIIDLHWYLLPDQFVWPLVLLALVFASVRTVIDDPEVVLNHAFYGALACWGVFYALFRVSQGRWIGGGDVKLAIFIGLLLGPQQGLLALLLSFYLATAVILPGLLLKRLSRKDPIPFGPFLIASVIIMQLFGPDLTDWLRTFLSLS